GTTFLSVPIPFWGPLPEVFFLTAQTLLIGSAIALGLCVLRRVFATGELFPVPAQLTLLTITSAFVLDPASTGIFWLYLAAYFHGAQYLLVVFAQRIKEHGLPEGVSAHKIAGQVLKRTSLKFFGVIVVLTFGIYHAIPFLINKCGFETVTVAASIFA